MSDSANKEVKKSFKETTACIFRKSNRERIRDRIRETSGEEERGRFCEGKGRKQKVT